MTSLEDLIDNNYKYSKKYLSMTKNGMVQHSLWTSDLIRPSYTVRATIFEKVFRPEKPQN